MTEKRVKQMKNDKLHGFAFRDSRIASSANDCHILLADSRVLHIINEISKVYADIFMWFSFISHNEEAVSKGFSRETMTLLYDNKSDINGGIEINFYIWGSDKLEIDTIAVTEHDTDSENENGICQSWYIANANTESIADDLMQLLDVYFAQDFEAFYEAVENYEASPL